MAYDLIIKNGTVIDGTGSFRRRADVAVKDGIVAEIGRITDGAAKTIDASDLIVAPGFVDPHTHYDAQICWDPLVSCTSWHGVTTVLMGNCGVGIAPCKAGGREVAAWDLVNVEAIPFEALAKGISWEWETFPDFMAAAERRGAGINLAFLAPLTPFRRYVLGDESMEREARPEEIAQIASAPRGDHCRRVRIFDDHTAPAHRLPGPAARMPARLPRRTESLRQCVARSRTRRDRSRAHSPRGRRLGAGIRPARISFERERAPGQLARDREPTRSTRRERRYA